MTNLNEVLEFIKNSEKSELKSIYNAYAIRWSELRHEQKESFKIGDIVKINHKTVSRDDRFRVIKIMSKNIKVVKTNIPEGHVSGEIRVSPGLLEVA
jgi:ribosomal protein S17